MRCRLSFILALLMICVSPARASSCEDAYNHAVYPYWLIVNDILTYYAIFDNYDHLCTKYYPDVIKGLQPGAGQLRAQVKRDDDDAPLAMRRIFDVALPNAVPSSCRADKKARAKVLVRVLAAMQGREKTIAARLHRDSDKLPDPQNDLALCRQLPGLAPVVQKTLGPDLAHPLLEMSVINSHWMTGSESTQAPAVAAYRAALVDVERRK